MAEFVHDNVADAALAYIRDNGNRITICNAQPTTATEANATYALGTLGLGTVNYTIANGDANGRKITVSAATLVVGTSGTIDHVSVVFGTTAVLVVGTCTPTAVTAGGTVIVAAWDCDEISDAT